MTPEDCLEDEIKYLQSLLLFFEKIKFEMAISTIQVRIEKLKDKLNHLKNQNEVIY